MRPSMNARDASDTGAYVQPQLPTTSVVTPCRIVLCAAGFVSRVKSLWLWGSTNPGQMTRPAASIVWWASAPSSSPTAVMRPSSIATSPRNGAAPVPSTTSPSRISRSSAIAALLRLDDDLVGDAAEPRVEDVAQAVAEEVEPEHGEHDREPGEDRHPDARLDEVPRRREHVPPRGLRRLRAEPEEAEERLPEDRLGEVDGREHDQRRDDVRQDVAGDDPHVVGAERPRGFDEGKSQHLQ